ncbi:hypothetical protein ABIB35_001708 [Arthrobacter sp. UYP6]|uniref:hypothetical protein n=1 Tax=Arthrobacter sp. UYP6 TaxID=1756378 RepID=UPI0033912D82
MFVQFFPAVITESFLIILLTAALLKLVLEGVVLNGVAKILVPNIAESRREAGRWEAHAAHAGGFEEAATTTIPTSSTDCPRSGSLEPAREHIQPPRTTTTAEPSTRRNWTGSWAARSLSCRGAGTPGDRNSTAVSRQ